MGIKIFHFQAWAEREKRRSDISAILIGVRIHSIPIMPYAHAQLNPPASTHLKCLPDSSSVNRSERHPLKPRPPHTIQRFQEPDHPDQRPPPWPCLPGSP